jgi:hypothetical protein
VYLSSTATLWTFVTLVFYVVYLLFTVISPYVALPAIALERCDCLDSMDSGTGVPLQSHYLTQTGNLVILRLPTRNPRTERLLPGTLDGRNVILCSEHRHISTSPLNKLIPKDIATKDNNNICERRCKRRAGGLMIYKIVYKFNANKTSRATEQL